MVKKGWFFSSILAVMLFAVSLASAQSGVPLTLVRGDNSITLIVGGNQPANIENLTFEVQVTTAQGTQTISRRLDSLASFMGIPFERTPAPSCFHIEVSGSRDPISANCSPATLFRQVIAPADQFWVDGLGNSVPINILNGETYLITCPATGNCAISYSTSGGVTATAQPTTQTTPPPAELDCVNQLGVAMVYVPQTTFAMGLRLDDNSAIGDEYRVASVMVDAFCIDVSEVTNAQYAFCVNAGRCARPSELDAQNYPNYYETQRPLPVVNVTWQQAQDFCAYRAGEGRQGRLPSEAEWELVARHDPATGEMRTYPWGNESPAGDNAPGDELANFASQQILPGGRFSDGDSAYGLHDLSGNVAEWVYDGYAAYSESNTVNPMGNDSALFRVIRGGSYADDANDIRGSIRRQQSPTVAANDVGFRCVMQDATP